MSKNKGGRPRKDLTSEQVEQVEKLAAVLTQEQIADFLGMSDRTLRKRISEDPEVSSAYQRGRAKAVAGVATNLMQQARDGNVTAAIFYLKTQAGWKEAQKIEHSGPEGGPIEVNDGLSDDERAARVTAVLDRARARRDRQPDPADSEDVS